MGAALHFLLAFGLWILLSLTLGRQTSRLGQTV
jgi:hypothetical protein